MRIGKQWNRLPRKIVQSPSTEFSRPSWVKLRAVCFDPKGDPALSMQSYYRPPTVLPM